MNERNETTRAQRPPKAARVTILESHESERVSANGAVGSVQEAEIVLDRSYLEQIWSADNLELLARGYWAFLRKMFLGLIRVVYSPTARTVVFVSERLPLLRFGTPRYEAGDGRGCVTWPIERGLLVAREGRGQGHLQIRVERPTESEGDGSSEVKIRAQVEVKNFYPGLRGRGWIARFGAFLYAQTQLRMHVLVCNAYLRSLPKIKFPDVDTSSMPEDSPLAESASS